MKQLWHKAKALFGFGPEEPQPDPMVEHADDPKIAQAFDERFMPARDAEGAIPWPPATANSLTRLAVMAQPVVTEDQPRPTHTLIRPWGDAPNQ